MGPTEKSFQQVKSIISKLDRNIDQLRSTRTRPAMPAPAPQQQQAAPLRAASPIHIQQAQQPPRPASIYGRAKPIPPAGA